MQATPQNIVLKYRTEFIAVVLLLILVTFIAILHFNGLYGEDGYEYLRYFNALKVYYRTGANPGDMMLPMFYPFAGSFFPRSVFSLQLLSILAFCISFIYIGRIIVLVYKPLNENSVPVYLLLFYFLSPYVFRFSVLVMSDMLALVFCAMTMYFTIQYLDNKKYKNLGAAVFFALCASLTRTACVGLISVPVLFAGFQFVKKFRLLQFIGLLVLVALCLLPDYLLRHKLFIFELVGNQLHSVYLQMHPAWSAVNWFRHNFQRVDEYQSYNQPNIVYVLFNAFHPAYLFAGIVFCFFMKRSDYRNRYMVLVIGTVLFYAIFLAGMDLQNMRYLLPSFPFVMVVFYPAFGRALNYLSGRRALYATCAITVVLVQLVCTAYSFRTVYKMNRYDRQTAEAMKSYPGKTIYTLDLDLPLRTYGVTNHLINLYSEKLVSVNPNSLALVDTLKMKKQFSGHNPETNWRYIEAFGHPKYIRTFKSGEQLFALNP
jgi:hypothetical protein